jgi:hypothetical protein
MGEPITNAEPYLENDIDDASDMYLEKTNVRSSLV